MAKHFLDDYVKSLPVADKLPGKTDVGPRYNHHGDCIEYRTVPDAFIGDRIDDYLTIYRSAIDNAPIGFQIKEVRALLQRFGFDGMAFFAQKDGDCLVSVSAVLLAAYDSSPRTIKRRSNYAEAVRALSGQRENDSVQVASSLS